MDSVCVICPVCALNLRTSTTLKTHLNTHPKQVIIKALLSVLTSKSDCDVKADKTINSSTYGAHLSNVEEHSLNLSCCYPTSVDNVSGVPNRACANSTIGSNQNVCTNGKKNHKRQKIPRSIGRILNLPEESVIWYTSSGVAQPAEVPSENRLTQPSATGDNCCVSPLTADNVLNSSQTFHTRSLPCSTKSSVLLPDHNAFDMGISYDLSLKDNIRMDDSIKNIKKNDDNENIKKDVDTDDIKKDEDTDDIKKDEDTDDIKNDEDTDGIKKDDDAEEIDIDTKEHILKVDIKNMDTKEGLSVKSDLDDIMIPYRNFEQNLSDTEHINNDFKEEEYVEEEVEICTFSIRTFVFNEKEMFNNREIKTGCRELDIIPKVKPCTLHQQKIKKHKSKDFLDKTSTHFSSNGTNSNQVLILNDNLVSANISQESTFNINNDLQAFNNHHLPFVTFRTAPAAQENADKNSGLKTKESSQGLADDSSRHICEDVIHADTKTLVTPNDATISFGDSLESASKFNNALSASKQFRLPFMTPSNTPTIKSESLPAFSAKLSDINGDTNSYRIESNRQELSTDGCSITLQEVEATSNSLPAASVLEHDEDTIETVNIRADEPMPPCGELSGQGDESTLSYRNDGWEARYSSVTNDGSTNLKTISASSSLMEEGESKAKKAAIVTLMHNSLSDRFTTERANETSTATNYCIDDTNCNTTEYCDDMMDLPHSVPLTFFDQNVFTNKFNNSPSVTFANYINKMEKSETPAARPAISITCSFCKIVFNNWPAFRQHQFNEHKRTSNRNSNSYVCSTCNASMGSSRLFNDHLKVHPIECEKCGKLFNKRRNHVVHMRRHLNIRPFNCPMCDKKFFTKQLLGEHVNIHTGELPIKCKLCDASFRRHSNLVAHRDRHHTFRKKKTLDHICTVCYQAFATARKLAWHEEVHERTPKSCPECKAKFIHRSSLTRHIRRAHNSAYLPPNDVRAAVKPERPSASLGRQNVKCPVCHGTYLKTSLEAHMRIHNTDNTGRFRCHVCNKHFSTNWNLKIHQWTHATRSSKPFKCQSCSLSFVRACELTEHMNMHKNVRPFTCDHCGAKFFRKTNCQRHMREHEQQKEYKCTVCQKHFHRSYYLKDHMRIHSGARPYKCIICGKTSNTKSNHNKHLQIHHAREPATMEN